MIRSCRHRGLKRLYEHDDARRVAPDLAATVRGALMAMKNPVHPGLVVRSACLEPLNLTVTQAATAIGVTRQALNNVVNGKAAISPEMAIRLEKAFGGSAETWLAMQVAWDLAQVRKRKGAIKVDRIRRSRSAA